MKLLTFPGGIHPKYNKAISIREPLREGPLPDRVIIPFSQHTGAPNEPLVKKGDYVEEGQVIGTSPSFISSPVHSSVFGTVKEIHKEFHPVLGPSLSAVIERDKEKEARTYSEAQITDLDSEALIGRIRESGLVGMGGAAFPTHVKLSPPEGKRIDTLIINGAECEPYLTCDHVLMTRKTAEILKGIELIIGILNPDRTFIAVEDNKKASYFAFQNLIKTDKRSAIREIKLALLKTKYPQGGEKQLIKAITGREVPPGKLPLDVGCLVQNTGTIFAVYEAVYCNKPLIERIITLSGDCLEKPGNYRVKVGTSLKDIIESCGIKFEKEPAKIIFGGPMMGISQPDIDVPILKGSSGALFFSEKLARDLEEGPCVRCAKCIDVCPMHLSPTNMVKNGKKHLWDAMEELRVADCMECGSCSYICPARIPLVQYIKEGKSALRKKS